MKKDKNLLALLTLATVMVATIFSCTMPAGEVAGNKGIEFAAQAEAEEVLPENVKSGYFRGQKIYYEVVDGKNIYQGDIIMSDKQISDKPGRGNPLNSEYWPDNTVYYQFNSTGFHQPTYFGITRAIYHFRNEAGINFVEGVGTGDYIQITLHPTTNSSSLGMVGGKQYLYLVKDAKAHDILHQFGHALGLLHEHTRENRDDHININWSNIRPEKHHIFKKADEQGYLAIASGNTFYDFDSMMSLPSYLTDSSIVIDPNVPVFTKKDGSTFDPKPRNMTMGDAIALSYRYNNRAYVFNAYESQQKSRFEDFHRLMGYEKGANIIPGDFDGNRTLDFIRQERGVFDNDDVETFSIYFSNNKGAYNKVVPEGYLYQIYLKGDEGANIIPGDFNGDGKTDFIRQEKNKWDQDSWRTFAVYFSNGDGTFNIIFPEGNIYQSDLKGDETNIIAGDYNGDGKTDFIRQEKGLLDDDNLNTFMVYFSKGDGTFTTFLPSDPNFQSLMKSDDGCNLIAGDFNGDKKCDFIRQEKNVLDNDEKDNFMVYFSKGDGTFTQVIPDGYQYQDRLKADMGCNIIPGDFNGDGKTDFIRQEHSGWDDDNLKTFEYYFSNGDGTFKVENPIHYIFQDMLKGDNGTNIIPGDFDSDGVCDFIRQEKGQWSLEDDKYSMLFYLNKIRPQK